MRALCTTAAEYPVRIELGLFKEAAIEMTQQRAESLPHRPAFILVLLATAILFCLNPSPTNAAQKRSRATAAIRKPRPVELHSVDQLKEAFESDAGKIRMVVLVSPT